jgi:hypothetical protein
VYRIIRDNKIPSIVTALETQSFISIILKTVLYVFNISTDCYLHREEHFS